MTRNDAHETEAQSRWPDQYAVSQKRLGKLSAAQQRELFLAGEAVTAELAQAFLSGGALEDDIVQEIVGRHYLWIDAFWTPSQAAYIGLGQMYVSDERFAQNYEKQAAGLALFMSQAMAVWAKSNLS